MVAHRASGDAFSCHLLRFVLSFGELMSRGEKACRLAPALLVGDLGPPFPLQNRFLKFSGDCFPKRLGRFVIPVIDQTAVA
jgi:hypothetical protein